MLIFDSSCAGKRGKLACGMAPAVKLRELTAALELPEEWGAWLDRETGRVITLDPETQAADDDPEADDDDSLRSTPLATDEELLAARGIAAGEPRYLALPDKFDFHEYRHMERFVAGVADPRIADQLWRAIKGKGAFRHFKDTAHRVGLIDAWYQHREAAMNRFVLDWAEANKVTVDQT